MKISFVWPFWQAPAKYDELRWSIRSVYQNFVEPDCEIETVIVGDQPVIRRHSSSWYGGKVIHVPRLVRGSGRSGVEDQCGKFEIALRDETLADTVVWMMDDVYLIKPVTLADLKQPRSFGQFTTERLNASTPKGWWQRAKYETARLLLENGHTAYDFATHLPHVVDRKTALALIEQYDVPKRQLLWEMIYENINLRQTPINATPFLRIISDAKCLNATRNATSKASVLVSAGNSWNEPHRAFLYETFPHRSPVEVDDPIPPKLPVSVHLQAAPAPVQPQAPAIHRSRPLITTVLNCYGRPQAFPCQLTAIQKQSVASEVMVWQNAHEPSKPDWKRDWFDAGQMMHAGCNRNLGVWSRFAFALNAKTEFVCVWDDDIVPGHNWYQACLDTFAKYPGLLGGNGVIFHSLSNYDNRTNYGWAYPNRYVTQVDIVGHVWFMRREWLGLYWSEMPTFDQPEIAGEDFHASYMLQKHGINTFVPQHRRHQPDRWSCRDPKQGKHFGRANVALSKHSQHSVTIRGGLDLYVKKGFKLIEHDRLNKEANSEKQFHEIVASP